MTKFQKQENVKFFKSVISNTKNGGYYIYPNEALVFQVLDGKLVGDERGVFTIKKLTTQKFHNKVVLK